MVICLERGADWHTAQLMPLPLTVSCFSKIQIGFTFLVPAHPGSPEQRAVKRVCVCVCVCVCVSALPLSASRLSRWAHGTPPPAKKPRIFFNVFKTSEHLLGPSAVCMFSTCFLFISNEFCRTNYLKICPTDLRQIFWVGRTSFRSINGSCHGNQLLWLVAQPGGLMQYVWLLLSYLC